MPWILLLLFSLFSAPSLAVTLPGVTTGATATQQNAPPEPDAEKKKAAYGALADVLENDTSRQELIDQLLSGRVVLKHVGQRAVGGFFLFSVWLWRRILLGGGGSGGNAGKGYSK